jgi:hypothetical protein
MLPQPSRRGPESNRCAGLCRPLPKPLGHPAGMEQPGFPGLALSLTCDRKAARFSLRSRLRRTLVPWTRRIGVLSAAPTSFGRPHARATSKSWCAGCATGPQIPGSVARRQTDRRTSPFAVCSLRRSSRTNKRTDPRDEILPGALHDSLSWSVCGLDETSGSGGSGWLNLAAMRMIKTAMRPATIAQINHV